MTQDVIRSETERQFYLGMAGIRMWYARAPLPGAAPSPAFDFGVSASEAPEPTGSIAPTVRPNAARESAGDIAAKKDKLAHLKTLMSTVPDKSAPPTRRQTPAPVEEVATKPSPAPADEVATASESLAQVASYGDASGLAPKLCLQFWSGQQIFLLANLSEDASLSLQETLARNIVRSLGDSDARESEILRWPLFNNLKVSLNSETDLAALMRGFVAAAKGKTVISLGLSPEESVISVMLADVLEKSPDLVFEHSLAALAADPGLKKQLWQVIKPLTVNPR